MAEEDIIEVDAELAAVMAHRRARFIELGFAPRTARILAEKGADWHEAERLLKHGCPHGIAAKLLV